MPHAVSCLARAIQNDNNKTYVPTIRSVIEWADTLNRHVFDGRCPEFDNIDIRKLRGKYGECYAWIRGKKKPLSYYSIRLHKDYENLTMFLNILAHEMAHAVEYHETEEMDHGDHFWQWKDVMAAQGLTLKSSY